MADLETSLAQMGMNTRKPTRVHEVHFSFCLDLLPKGVPPSLVTPRNLAYRDMPRLDTFLLKPDDLDFWYRFPAASGTDTATMTDDVEMGGEKTVGDLTSVMDLMKQRAGVYELSFAPYMSETKGRVFRFRLQARPTDEDSTEHSLEVEEVEVGRFFEEHNQGQAETMLLNLIDGASDRAYLHLHAKLYAADPTYATAEAAGLELLWSMETLPTLLSPTQTLMDSLIADCRNGKSKALSTIDTINMNAHGNAELQYWLPCGHIIHVTYHALCSMSERDCLQAQCRECGRVILSAADRFMLALPHDKEQRDEYSHNAIYWDGLDEPVGPSSCALDTTPLVVYDALISVLESFKVPESATPTLLCPAHFPETAVLMAELGELLRKSSLKIMMTPQALLATLEEQARHDLCEHYGRRDIASVHLPPRYMDFVGRWLRRTVNVVAGSPQHQQKREMEEMEEMMGGVQMA